MKIVRVTVRRGGAGEDMMLYPDAAHGGPYDPYEVDRVGIGPRMSNGMCAYSGDIGKGGDREYCIIVLPDELADTYAEHADMEIVTDAEADTLQADWRVKQGMPEEVLDETAKAQADLYAAKTAAGLSLSQDEQDKLSALSITKAALRPISEIIAEHESRSALYDTEKAAQK